jgi:hypothetical protein
VYKTPEPRTDILSLRIPAERLEHLKKEASTRKISLNVLANHIIDAYFDFTLPSKNVGFVSLPKKTLRDMIGTLNEAQLFKLANGPVKAEFVNLVYMMKGKLTLQSFLNTFLAWARDSNFPYRDDYDDGKRTITIHHDMGKKWSLLLNQSVESVLKEMGESARFDLRDDVLVMRIEQDT